MNKPNVNVTPLIDVLLVLLIIFMVVSPLKPSSFKTKIPHEPTDIGGTNINTLVVRVHSDLSLSLNSETGLGTAGDPAPLVKRLEELFRLRAVNADYTESTETDPAYSSEDRVQRTVFIKAPRNLDYGSVAKVVDAVKISGAVPISLQVDDLE